MKKEKKKKIVTSLKNLLAKTKGLVLLDYKGLKTSQITDFRERLKEKDCQFKVVKNTLFSLALSSSGYPKIELEGPTSIAFGKDIFPILSLLQKYEFEKRIKLGFFEKKLIPKEKLNALAKIPSLDYLKSLLVSYLNSLFENLVFTLESNLNQLVFILERCKERR